MLAGEAERAADTVAVRLPVEQGGELHLPARPPVVHDQHASNGLGDVAAQVLLDHGKAHVDPGGNPGRRPDAAVLDEDAIAIDPDGRMQGLQPSGPLPVSRRRTPLQQAGGGQDEGAGADAGQAADATCALHERDHRRGHPGHNRSAAHDGQGVEACHRRRVRLHGQARSAPDGAATQRHDLATIAARHETACPLEHLQRAAEVQQIERGIDEKADAPCHRGSTVCSLLVIGPAGSG